MKNRIAIMGSVAAGLGAALAMAGLDIVTPTGRMPRAYKRQPIKTKSPTTQADHDAIAKAQAKRLRKSNGKNKDRV